MDRSKWRQPIVVGKSGAMAQNEVQRFVKDQKQDLWMSRLTPVSTLTARAVEDNRMQPVGVGVPGSRPFSQ
jgi:hypothetical protein